MYFLFGQVSPVKNYSGSSPNVSPSNKKASSSNAAFENHYIKISDIKTGVCLHATDPIENQETMILLTPEGDVWENDFSVVKLFAFYFKNLFPETKLEAQWNEFILAGRKKADSLNFSFEEEPKAHILVELTLQEHVQFILQSLLNVQSEGSVVLLSYIAKQREYLRKEINFLQNKIQSNLKYLKLLKESKFDCTIFWRGEVKQKTLNEQKNLL
eukprot:GHVP01059726.1.p2 GENE.GHVP01059726.1~~GHVP01059726.1.p2  ORF type:complete len:214 (+),score=47.40 GHVP01059726.1:1417-2058(+)